MLIHLNFNFWFGWIKHIKRRRCEYASSNQTFDNRAHPGEVPIVLYAAGPRTIGHEMVEAQEQVKVARLPWLVPPFSHHPQFSGSRVNDFVKLHISDCRDEHRNQDPWIYNIQTSKCLSRCMSFPQPVSFPNACSLFDQMRPAPRSRPASFVPYYGSGVWPLRSPCLDAPE
jgi:hypothetical protein